MVDVIILAGGLGTRLAQTVPSLPKALAPIQGIPFLQILLDQLERAQIAAKIVFALGHKASDILSYLQTKNLPFPLEVSIEPSPLGTGGAVLYALEKTTSDTLLILNGDSYFDLSLPSFLAFHKEKKAALSMACREMEDTSRYGTVIVDSSLRVLSFREKSPHTQKGWINAGIYLVQRELFNSFTVGHCYSLEKDFLPSFLEKEVFAYPHTGTFIDIGTHHSYCEAQQILQPWI